MSTRRSKPRISAANRKIVTILVGESKEPFMIHEDVLTYHSDFFRAALTGDFQEAREKTVTLEGEDMQIFEFFVHWVYYQRFPSDEYGDDGSLVKAWTATNDKGRRVMDNLVKLHVFGDRFLIAKLRNDTVNEICDLLSNDTRIKFPTCQLTRSAFQQLPSTSPLCRLLVDLRCYWLRVDKSDEDQDWPVQFLIGVMERYANLLGGCVPGKFSAEYDLYICDYHDHEGRAEKCACPRNRKMRD